MIVVDASAFVSTLVYADSRGAKARAAMMRDTEWTAPDHWKAEVFAGVRGLTLGHKITGSVAARAVALLPQLGVDQVSIDALLPRMWQLRHSVSGYDAAYVALAEARALTLVTGDAGLARTATAYCRVELVN